MLKPQDVVVLVELLENGSDRTVRSIGDALSMDVAGVHRSLARLEAAHLWNPRYQVAPLPAVREFLVHAVRYMFPVELGRIVRGTPAAWAAAPLVSMMAPGKDGPVWPDPHGVVRGPALEPLHRSLLKSAADRPGFAETFALIDSLRAGDARVRGLAIDELNRRLDALEVVA